MKIIKIFIIFFINLFCTTIYSQTIAIINVQLLIDNNAYFKSAIEKINISQKDYSDKFQIREAELNELFQEIEDAKLILSENEINLQINQYNKQIEEFSLIVDSFNVHYQNQIISLREKILNEIIIILEKYARDNKIDLILDSTSYLIASNNLDITDTINEELKRIKLELDFKDFEEN